MTEEHAIYQDADVWISRQRAIFQGNTYAMSQVSAVSARTVPPSRVGAIMLLIFGFLAMALGGMCFMFVQEPTLFFIILGIGAFMVVCGIVLWVKGRPTYVIWLNTSGGQVQALWSKDWPYIERVHDALQQAVISRG